MPENDPFFFKHNRLKKLHRPSKFNMDENDGFQGESPFPGAKFQGSMLNFGSASFKFNDSWN